jgi:hypothetical protein
MAKPRIAAVKIIFFIILPFFLSTSVLTDGFIFYSAPGKGIVANEV